MADANWDKATLEVTPLGPFERWEDAWAALPGQGDGWVMTPDAVVRFRGAEACRFVAAEVAHGPISVHVRHDGDAWRAWRYVERPGDEHEKRTRLFEGTRASHCAPPGALEYAEYWELRPDPLDPELKVWTPAVTRFVGFAGRES